MALEIKIDAHKKGIPISFNDLEKQLKDLKDIPWIADVPANTLSKMVQRVGLAYEKFFKGGGFPKYRSKKDYTGIPFRQDSNVIRFESPTSIRLPKLGEVRVFKDKVPEGKIVTATLTKKIGKYYLNVTTEVEKRPLPVNENQVGIDVGLSQFCVMSDGTFVAHPQLLAASQKRLRIAQRKLARTKKGGANRKKQVRIVAKLHAKVARQRNDFLQKLSTSIIQQNGSVFIEDLNVSGMIKSNLARRISDSGWGHFRKMIAYKSDMYVRNFVAVPARHTSQECNQCGHTSSDNRLTQSQFKCVECQHETNADLNASINILRRGQRLSSESTDISLRLGEAPKNGCQIPYGELTININSLNK